MESNLDRLKKEYPDKVIIIHDKRVISSGTNYDEALAKARNIIGNKINDSVMEY